MPVFSDSASKVDSPKKAIQITIEEPDKKKGYLLTKILKIVISLYNRSAGFILINAMKGLRVDIKQ